VKSRNTVPDRSPQAGNSPNPRSNLYVITADLDDGQVCPPYTEDGIPWRVVQRRNGRTLWRRGSQRVRP
jgi:hypothetical protein